MASVVPFVGQTYRYSERDISSQDAVNIEPLRSGSNSKTKRYLKRTEGLGLWCDLTGIVPEDRPGRAVFTTSMGDLYVFYGDSLISVDPSGNPTKVMDVTDGISPGSMCELNGNLFVCDGTSVWGYNYDTGQKRSVGLPFSSPTKILVYGKRMLAINADTTVDVVANNSKFYWSDLNDGYTWNPISFQEAYGRDDFLTGIEIVSGGILTQGQTSIETYTISSDPYRPFRRVSVVPYGGLYSWLNSTVTPTGTSCWVSAGNDLNNVIVSSQGGNFEMISTPPINAELAKYDTTKDVRVWSYLRAGYEYVVLTFLSEDITWVYNTTEKSWHRRASRDPLLNTQHYYTPLFHSAAYGMNIVGSITGAYLMILDSTKYDEWDFRYNVGGSNEKPILVQYVSPVYWSDKRFVFHDVFELDMDTGGAPLYGNGSDPKMTLYKSDDGGYAFSKGRSKSFGKRGKYKTRVRWRGNGGTEERVYKLETTSAAPVTILNAFIQSEKGIP